MYDGTNNIAPFTGAGLNPVDPNEPGAQQNTISSATFAEALFCDACTLTVYSKNSFGGRSEVYDHMESPYQLFFPFCIKSFILDCETGGNSGGGEEEEEEEEQAIEFELTDFTPELIELRDYGAAEVISLLINDNSIPNSQYEIVEGHIYNTVEVSTNTENIYQYNIIVKDQQDKEWIVRFQIAVSLPYRDIVWYQGFPN